MNLGKTARDAAGTVKSFFGPTKKGSRTHSVANEKLTGNSDVDKLTKRNARLRVVGKFVKK